MVKKSWAEYKRASRNKAREERRDRRDESSLFLRNPFFKYFRDSYNKELFEIPLHLANVNVPEFIDDSPAVFPSELEGLELPDANSSLERAELVIACLIDAASGLAVMVNEFKRDEIVARIGGIEKADLLDVQKREEAHLDIIRLKKMLAQLNKQVRWTFPQWKVTTGE